MSGAERVLQALEVVALVLSWIALPLLVLAIVVRWRRGDRPRGRVAKTGWLAMGLVVSLVVLAALLGVLRGVPAEAGIVSIALLAALLVCFAGDDRFWAAGATLFVAFTIIGFVLLLGVSSSYVDEVNGYRWYGSRWLISLGGLEANPAADRWWVSAWSVAVLRFGLPLAVAVVAAYQASTRRDLMRIERLGLTATSGAAITATFGSAAALMISFIVGAFVGVDPVLATLGIAGSVVILVLVGPGSVDAFLVGGRTLWSWLPGRAATVAEVGASARDLVGGDDTGAGPAPRVGFLTWARGNVGRATKVWLGLGGVVLVLMVLSATGAWGVPADAVRVDFETVDREVEVGFVVVDTHPAPDGARWLVGDGGRVALFDPAAGAVRRVEGDREAVALAPRAEHELVGVVPGDPARLVRFDAHGGAPREIAALAEAAPGRDASLAVDGDAVYLADGDGSLGRWSTSGGPAVVSTSAEPDTQIVGATSRGVWTVRDTGWSVLGDFQVTLRNPALEPVDAGELMTAVADLRVGADGSTASAITGLARLEDATGEALLVAQTTSDDDRFGEIDAKAPSFVLVEPFGVATRYRPREAPVRRDFHYDSVVGFVPGDDATWVVATDDRGIIVDATAVETSVVARWRGNWDHRDE